MSDQNQANEFSPAPSHSPSISLDFKAFSPEHSEVHPNPNSNEMVDLIENYEEKKLSPVREEPDEEMKEPLNEQHMAIDLGNGQEEDHREDLKEDEPRIDQLTITPKNVVERGEESLKRKYSGREEDELSQGSLKKVKRNTEVKSLAPIEETNMKGSKNDEPRKSIEPMDNNLEQELIDEEFDAEVCIRKKKTLKDDFEPGIFEPAEQVLSAQDLEIVRLDTPERLQGRVKKPEEVTNELLLEEAKWICDHFKAQRNAFPNENFLRKVQKSLSFLKVSQMEILHQYYYKKNELFPEVQLPELWEIYELDEEWEELRHLKECMKHNMKMLENFMEIPKSTVDLMELSPDRTNLSNLNEYAMYFLAKYLEGEAVQKMAMFPNSTEASKKLMKRTFMYDALQLRIDQFAAKAGLSCEEFVENLASEEKSHKKIQLKKPKYVAERPEQIAQEYLCPGKALVHDTLATLMTLCRYMASEIFQDPVVRIHLRKIYFENVTLSTEPTLQGNKELEIFNPYYIVKRISRRPPKEFQDDLWLKMMKGEKEGLIKIRVILPWELDLKDHAKDFNDMKDEIYNLLLKLYIASYTDANEQEKTMIIQWNIVRGEALRVLLTDLLYPHFEKTLKEELTETAEKYVVSYCGKKLKEILNTAPYLVPAEGDTYSQRGFVKPKIVSVVLESPGNQNQMNSGKISFVAVDSDGRFVEGLTLKFFAIQNLEGQNPSVKEQYEKDYSEFARFMARQQPDLVIVSANCLDSRRIKQMMMNFREDYLKANEEIKRPEDPEILRQFNNNSNNNDVILVEPLNQIENSQIEPSRAILIESNQNKITPKKAFNIIYGDSTVPSLFAKTRRAEMEFKGCPLTIKEAVSIARFAQNPLAETLNLWSEKNQENALFYIPFHPLQNQITLARLRKEFERVVLEAVSAVGLDFNEAIRFDHLNASLQFICGLGPKKATHLIETMRNKGKNGFQGLRSRAQFLTDKLMERRVYTNCAGFLKVEALSEREKIFDFEVEKRPETLDITRIHPDNYGLAKKIAKDALEEDAGTDLIPKIMRNSFKLKELDLEDYANHMASFKNKPNMIFMLNFIVEELIFPFRDPRSLPFLYTPKDIFYKLSKESPETFRVNCVVNARVNKVLKLNLLCQLENGLVGSAYCSEIFEKKDGMNESLNQFFEEGQKVKVKVKSIDFEKFKIELTMKPSELKPHKNQLKDLFPNYWESLSKFFKISNSIFFELF